jgi:hypothetical protein
VSLFYAAAIGATGELLVCAEKSDRGIVELRRRRRWIRV